MNERARVLGVVWLAVAAAACGGGGGAALPLDASGTGAAAATAGAQAPAPAPAPDPAPTPVAGTAPAPAPVPAPAAPPAIPLSRNVAAWGDSLTGPVVVNMRFFADGREIYNGGISGETSTQILARHLADTTERNRWINVFWYGHNNKQEPEKIKADVAASVAKLAPGNNRFVVLSVVNQNSEQERRGTPRYDAILRLNAELAAAYPDNYLDIRSFLVQQNRRQTARDLEDLANDVPPQALLFDIIHLNNDGSEAVAKRVLEFIRAKGW